MSVKGIYDWYVKAGYLKALHQGDLTLYNYTTQCVCKSNWNYHTRSARGLILDAEGNYIARPFSKFFTLNERQDTYPQNLPKETPEIAVKHDGSLVIVFFNPETKVWDAITRGCWDNQQTRYTKKWLQDNSHKLEQGYTYCFELTAPWNQVVIPYEETQMTLLGRVDQWGYESSYQETKDYADGPGLVSVEFEVRELCSIDVDKIPFDQEGYVARFPNGFRVKIKASHYEERHKELT